MDSASSRHLNREYSWLEFNFRVLHEARDPRIPLLERVKYLGITGSNLDEFVMKRVGGLKRQMLAQARSTGLERATPAEQLAEIRSRVQRMVTEQAQCFENELRPALKKEGILLLDLDQLETHEGHFVGRFFENSVFPVLTPLAVDPGHPFPFMSNLSSSFGLLLRDRARDNEEVFARVKVPKVFPAWIRVNPGRDDQEARYVSLHQIIGRNLQRLFPGMEILDVLMFRITRNADIEREEEDAEDLLEMVTEELRERRFAQVVRLEHGPNPNPRILSLLMEKLELSDSDIYELPLWLEFYNLDAIAQLNRPQLKFPVWVPVVPRALMDDEISIFDVIRSGDLLLHHPYDSFTASVERFIREAADDPRVLAIKMTLYRTGDDSPFIPLLIRAAERGKQVACLVELKARFDEERNILVAQALEKAGVHVVYGIVGLKTHSKVALVVRQEADGVRCYAHIGTGNYRSRTALLYTDLGLLTCDPAVTEDAVHLFHFLTGRSVDWKFRNLLIAPIDMKETLLRMIDREIQHAKDGRPSGIVAKMNNLEDRDICEALYRASGAGVSIELLVRSICCLNPGVNGLSENIRVTSTVGRFLEHSRLFHFRNGALNPADGEFLIGSADWMQRNLCSRVEAVVPIEAKSLRERCLSLLSIMLADRRLARDMLPGGTYVQRVPDPESLAHGCQAEFMAPARKAAGPVGDE